ncbi:hypothetical protein PT273_05000 [Orbaceae bacterium ESL0727]|nr:hypothetical protein [Orbaceae bacterium ESL0727]
MPLTVQAALSAITSRAIEGQAPYLTFDNGVTQAPDTAPLLTLKLSDGKMCTPTNNQCTEATPMELPVVDQTLHDVQMPVPVTSNTADLSTPIRNNNYWYDNNGDGEGSDGLIVTGNITVEIKDVYGDIFANHGARLDPCHAPYQITLTSDGGELSTQYGIPRSSNFAGSTITYYIKPKLTGPLTCYVQPNIMWSDNYDETQWYKESGFLPQNITMPSSNFPTIGQIICFSI